MRMTKEDLAEGGNQAKRASRMAYWKLLLTRMLSKLNNLLLLLFFLGMGTFPSKFSSSSCPPFLLLNNDCGTNKEEYL